MSRSKISGSSKKNSGIIRLSRAVASVEALESRQLLSASVSFAPAKTSELQTVSKAYASVVADVNGDGFADIVTLSANTDVSVLLGNGNGTFKPVQNVPDQLTTGENGPQSLAVADVNGKETIFASAPATSDISVITANSAGVWSVDTLLTTVSSSTINALTIAEIGGNQFIVTANQDGSVSYQEITPGANGTGFTGLTGSSTTIPSVITYGANGASTAALQSLAVGNFISSGTGTDLVVIGSNGKAAVLAGNGSGFNAPAKVSGDTTTITGVASAADVYNAATYNVLVRTTTDTIIPLTGGGASAANPFTAGSTINPESNQGGFISTGDFNGDGLTDFMFTGYNSGYSKLYTGVSGGGYSSGGKFNKTVNEISYTAAAGDFNGDGLADLAVGYYGSAGAFNAVLEGVSLNTTPLAPKFVGPAGFGAEVGSSFSQTFQVQGFPSPKITISGALPPGLAFKDNGNGTATISGKILPTQSGTFSETLKATNASGSATRDIGFDIEQKAVFTSAGKLMPTDGTAFTYKVKTTGGFSDGDFSPLSATFDGNDLSSGFDGITFHDNGNGTGTLSGTPIVDGIHTIVVTDGSGDLAVDQSITTTILSKPDFNGATTAAFMVGKFDTTAPSDLDDEITTTGFPAARITIVSGSLPKGLKFKSNGDGTADISGTPAAGAGGVYNIKLLANNSAGPGINEPFTYTIDVAQAPVITSPNHATFTVGKAGTKFVVTATGNSGTAPPSFSHTVDALNGIVAGTLPNGLTFTDNANGTATISGTPAAGTRGVYLLTIATATDASDTSLPSTATQTFTLTVDEAPAFASATDSSTVAAGSAIAPIVVSTTKGFPSIKMTKNGGLPAGLTFTDNGNGTATISGTPPMNIHGIFKFDIVASDLAGRATQKYTLTVDPPP
jgi:hypothetical protein